jgi:hypothetical protein
LSNVTELVSTKKNSIKIPATIQKKLDRLTVLEHVLVPASLAGTSDNDNDPAHQERLALRSQLAKEFRPVLKALCAARMLFFAIATESAQYDVADYAWISAGDTEVADGDALIFIRGTWHGLGVKNKCTCGQCEPGYEVDDEDDPVFGNGEIN